MNSINLKVSVEEANLIMEALGNMPFTRVYVLIGKIQEQAAQQLNSSGATASDAPQSATAPSKD